MILAVQLKFYKDDSRILLVSYFILPDLKVADIGSTNENATSPDGTAYNLGIKKTISNFDFKSTEIRT